MPARSGRRVCCQQRRTASVIASGWRSAPPSPTIERMWTPSSPGSVSTAVQDGAGAGTEVDGAGRARRRGRRAEHALPRTLAACRDALRLGLVCRTTARSRTTGTQCRESLAQAAAAGSACTRRPLALPPRRSRPDERFCAGGRWQRSCSPARHVGRSRVHRDRRGVLSRGRRGGAATRGQQRRRRSSAAAPAASPFVRSEIDPAVSGAVCGVFCEPGDSSRLAGY